MNYRMKVKVNPSTSQIKLRWRTDHLKVNLTAPPEDGKANEQLIRILADEFQISKSDVEIVAGETEEFKTVKMENLDREQLVRRLNDLKG